MAELPRVPFPDSTTRPIQDNLSASDIAGPYTEIARASDKLSGAASDVAVPLAEQAAARAVRRDDNGNLIVDKLPPLFGEAAKSARLTIAAKLQPQIETDLLKHKLENRYDPAGYMKAVEAYKPKLLEGMDSTLAVGVGKMVDNTSQQYLRSLLVERDNHETQEKIKTFNSRGKELDDQSGQIAFQHGTNTPEYRQIQADRKTWLDSMERDPRTNTSHETRVRLEQEYFDKDQAQAIIGSTYRTYQANKASPEAKSEAHKFLVDQFLGEGGNRLRMPIEKRLHYISEGTHMLESASAKDTVAIGDNRTAVNDVIKNLFEQPSAFEDMRVVDEAIKQSDKLGDAKSVAALQGVKDKFPLIKSIVGLTGPEAADLRERLIGDAQFGPASPAEAIYWKVVDKLKATSATGAEKAATEFKERAKLGGSFTADEITSAMKMATIGNKPELGRYFRDLYGTLEANGKVPPGGLKEELARVEDAKRAPAANIEVLNTYDQILKARAEGYDKDPLHQAWQDGIVPYQLKFDVNNPAAFTQSIADGQKSAELLQERWRQGGREFGPVKVVAGIQAEAVGQQIMYGPAQAAVSAMQSLGTLSYQNYKATLDQDPIRKGIIGASQTNDPDRFTGAFNTMRERWKKDPTTFKHLWGADTLDRVQAFAGMDGMPIEEKMKHLNYASDPSEAAGRDKRAEAAKDEVKKWSAQDVANQVGKGWPFIGRVTGSRPTAPVDENQADILQGEFSEAFIGLRKFGVPEARAKELAAERVGSEWQTSVANNGQLMKGAPEKYYQPTGDPKDPESFKYLPRDLDRHLTEVLGPSATMGPTMGEAGAEITTHWTFKQIMADDRTRTDYEQGKPPSYVVAYTDDRGHDQILDHRWAWDVGEPGTPEEKGYLGQTDRWSRNLPLGPMPSAVPTGHMAEARAKQQAVIERGREELRAPLAPGMSPAAALLEKRRAHARHRDGG